jgi:peptide/nickel transport system substrate-binding protein
VILRLLVLIFIWPLLSASAFALYVEPDMLKEKVAAGELPPVDQRVPAKPRIIDVKAMGREPGQYGGTARMIIGGQRDIRYMTIFGYARLIGYDERLNLTPDILLSYDVEDGRIFTFHLRPGHKWSDGQPLSTEDFRFSWEDVLNNEDLSPGGLSPYLLANGKPPKFEIIDDLTARYSWDAPNPDFLPQLASAQPLRLAVPAHYLKQFHKKYQDKDKLEELVKKNKAKNWKQLYTRKAQAYRPENPDLPTLEPWRNTTPLPAEQIVFERNPYYHRVDENGRQLPYIDRFELDISSSSLIPAKTGAGESDLQGTAIEFDDYTFLKEAEKGHPIKVSLWERTQGARIALFPNLNYEDPVWRKVLQDVRFRRALSLAIDRREINMAVFFGLANASANTVLPASPLYRAEYAEAWIKHDPDLANKLLDEMGLDKRDEDGFRLLPDGRTAQVVVESAGEGRMDSDALELIKDYWREIGIDLFTRASQLDLFRSRILAGQTMMSISSGIDNGIPTADMNPGELAPVIHDQLQWPHWGMYYETAGEKGSAPTLPAAIELMNLYKEWQEAATSEKRAEVWHRMLSVYTDNVFSIGIVNATLQPIVASAKLKNIPAKGLYSFNPTSYFGVYLPDTFWFDRGSQQ